MHLPHRCRMPARLCRLSPTDPGEQGRSTRTGWRKIFVHCIDSIDDPYCRGASGRSGSASVPFARGVGHTQKLQSECHQGRRASHNRNDGRRVEV